MRGCGNKNGKGLNEEAPAVWQLDFSSSLDELETRFTRSPMEGDKAGRRSVEFFFVDLAVQRLIAMSGFHAQLIADDVHVARSFDSDPYRVGSDTHNRHRHVVADLNLLTRLSREHEHSTTPFLVQ